MAKKDRGARKYPTKESIIMEIKRRQSEGLTLNYTRMRAEDDALRRRCVTLFGGYPNAVRAAGIDYESIKQDANVASRCGFEFERVFSALLSELGISHKKMRHGRLMPDFTLPNGILMDAKLSDFRVINAQCPTMRKYGPLCRLLTIVYMNGIDTDRLYGKTRIIHVNRFVKQLPKHRQKHYRRLFADINAKLTADTAA
ncbi:hypothetical protein [Bacillus amyloliquefaciens]|uniref:hypothetical protein n=1 Tax=Bacillus amyloliquefaciens TaxID=1390 RepID=UPI0011CACFF1|nr:hypothetical protein [Bacillus amyloliquefaciens]TXK24377.1 hypothetical protein FVD42_10370 [Bacillus amyloliquefaciens]TXK30593.1 hypothetical protein FVD41_10305 [Bacillus amyloliquefaciens]